MSDQASVVAAVPEEGAKRGAEELAAGGSPAKVLKVEPKDEVKEEVKDEDKGEVKKEESTEPKEKKEQKEHKEHKEHKDKKDKKEKKKEKHKDKKDKKENTHGMDHEVNPSPSPESNKELDQRKLFKAGQKFITPPAADPTRGFYESLMEENPESKIALRFCIEYGIMPMEQHKKMYKRFLHLKDKGAYDARILLAKTLARADRKEGKEKKEKKDKSEKKAKEV